MAGFLDAPYSLRETRWSLRLVDTIRKRNEKARAIEEARERRMMRARERREEATTTREQKSLGESGRNSNSVSDSL